MKDESQSAESAGAKDAGDKSPPPPASSSASATPSPKPRGRRGARERGKGVRLKRREALPPRTVKQVASRDKIAFAREQRREPTQTEERLWALLRDRHFGFKFRRQHPVGDFVLDFYCPEVKLAVEIDGPHHERQAGHDEWRSECLARLGITVLRIPEEACGGLLAVVERIRKACQEAGGRARG